MKLIPNNLRNSKTENAIRSVHAASYHGLRERHPKAFAIKADRGGFSGLVSMPGHEPDQYNAGANEVQQ
jgi:hypothetical protein